MPILDTAHNGMVDGIEFMLLFYRIRFEVRNKILTERLSANRMIQLSAAEREKQRLESLENARKFNISSDFTEEDSKSALEKLTVAATNFEKLMPESSQLKAFESEFIEPQIFRDQLLRVLNLRLTAAEIGALVRYFAKAEGEVNVRCSDFLVWFFRTGFEEKSKQAREKRLEQKRVQEERERKAKEEMEAVERKHALKVDLNFTEEEKKTALGKIRDAARLYDRNAPGALNMKAFDVLTMPPHVFKEQLNRIFNLKLSPAELGALLSVFEVNGKHSIDI